MVVRIVSIALLLAVAACNTDSEMEYDQSIADEESIDDVWHKARLRGVAFRAIGQEPGWLLEITDGEDIMISTDYGESVNRYNWVEPVVDENGRRTQYVIEKSSVTVEIRGTPCTDVMSGESFENSVTIIESDRRLEGCGKALF